VNLTIQTESRQLLDWTITINRTKRRHGHGHMTTFYRATLTVRYMLWPCGCPSVRHKPKQLNIIIGSCKQRRRVTFSDAKDLDDIRTESPPNVGAKYRWEVYSTNISLYLRNGARYGHSYNGTTEGLYALYQVVLFPTRILIRSVERGICPIAESIMTDNVISVRRGNFGGSVINKGYIYCIFNAHAQNCFISTSGL